MNADGIIVASSSGDDDFAGAAAAGAPGTMAAPTPITVLVLGSLLAAGVELGATAEVGMMVASSAAEFSLFLLSSFLVIAAPPSSI